MEDYSSNLVFKTPSMSCYLMDDSYPKFRQLLKQLKYPIRIIRVHVPGLVCGHHHKPIIGWHEDNGRTWDDDGYCSIRSQCWSEKGNIVVKRLLVFQEGTIIPSKNKELMDICKQEMSDPSNLPGGFTWIN